MEKVDELVGEANDYDFESRFYDSRLGRFFKTDPYKSFFPGLSPYHYGANNPIYYLEVGGNYFYASSKRLQETTLKSMAAIFGKDHGFSFDE